MRKKIKIILTLAICIGLILANTKANAKTGKLINETTRVRKEASTSSDTIELALEGETAEILSEEGEWYKVKYAGKTGYIRKDMLEVAGSEEESKKENTTPENRVIEEVANEEKNTEKKEENNSQTIENTARNDNSENIKIGDTSKISGTLEIKILPTMTSSVIGTIYENTEISVKDIINKWCYIETENTSGWVLLGKIKSIQNSENNQDVTEDEKNQEEKNNEENKKEEKEEESNKEEKTKTKYVSTETLNVREKAQNDANVIKQLTINTAVTVSEEVDSTWSKVTIKGVTGYVASKYLSDEKVDITSRSETQARTIETVNEKKETEQVQEENKEESESESEASTSKQSKTTKLSSSEGNAIVNYATQFIGNPYVYGGTSLTNGCDCSGFVMSVYSHFGYSLPHSSGSMRSVGVEVSESELQPGDILCFSGHVGIYIGNNTFVHAANEQKGIITTSLSSSYYQRKYICARRVL